MASGTLPTRPQAESAPAQGRYEDFIQKRLEHTRQQVRLADVASSLMLLAAGSLIFFLAVALLDHWVFSGGLNFIARLTLFSVWIAGAGGFVWRFLLPSLLNRINPVFAAQTIEQTRPTLKNSLINFLLLRTHQQDVAPVVYRAMEHRAAADLLQVPDDHAVERARIVHLACVLAGVVAVFALYLALSPKNPLTSAARVLLPWSSLPVPTRVQIEEVKPGSDVVFSDDRQEITAQVSGLREGEEVALLATTADNQVVDDRVVMTRSDDANHYRCELPAGSGGFQQDTFYRITAGDATTQTYKLEVQIAPTIVVDRIDYHFPDYTGMADHSIKNQGDIKALEGTQVTIHATANMEIKEAAIDLDCAGLRMHSMTSNGAKAVGQFFLPLYAEDDTKSPLTSYQIRFTDLKGNSVRRPVRYNVDVDRDLPPSIQFLVPEKEGELQVPEDGQLTIRVHALDPDYGLRRVTLHVGLKDQDKEQELMGLPVLLARIKPDKALVGAFTSTDYIFRPAEFHLKAGDSVRYWATADDNKEPRANHSDTRNFDKAPRTIKIVGRGQGGQQNPPDQPQNADGQNKQGAGTANKGSGEKNKSGTGKGDPSSGQSAADPDGKGGNEGSKSDKSDPNGKNNTSPDNKSSEGKDHAKPEKNNSGQGNRSPDQSDKNNSRDKADGEDKSSAEGDQPKKTFNGDETRADTTREILKDLEEQNKKDQQKQSGKPQGDQPQNQQQKNQENEPGKQNSPPQGGSEQGNPQKGSPQQSSGNKPDQTQQGSRGEQSGGMSADHKDHKGNSGAQSPQDGGQSDPQNASNPQNAPGQQPQNRNGQEGPKGQGTQQHQSPQQGNSGDPSKSDSSNDSSPNASPPKSGGQPNGDKNAAQQSPDGTSGSPNNGSKENAAKPSGGPKDGQSAGGQPKPDTNQAGGKPDQPGQSTGGEPKAGNQPSGGQDKKDQSANGSAPPNSENKKPGSPSGAGQEQLAQGGPKPNDKQPPSKNDGGSSSPMPGGDKPGSKPKEESGNSPGGGQGSQQKEKEQKQDGGGSSGGGDKPKQGQGNEPGDSGSSPKPGGTKPSSSQGGMSDKDGSQQKDPGKTGDPTSQDSKGAPDSQGAQNGNPKAGDAKPGLNQDPNNSQSPSTSEHDSSTSSDSPGHLKGGGGAGGGQPDKKSGKGAEGTQQPAATGGQVSKEHGPGANGNKPGQDVRAPESKGSSQHEQGQGNGEKHDSPEKQTAKNDSQKPPSDSTNGSADSKNPSGGGKPGNPSPQQAGNQGNGFPAGGSQNGTVGKPAASQHEPERGPDAADLDFANKQFDLALNHLKEQMAKQKPELLDRLGWTKEEGQKFLENLQKLKDSAQKPGSEGAEAKKAYNEFLKNLDLHPHGTQIRGTTRKDELKNVRDSGRMEPPAEYADQVHAYTHSTAGGK